MAYSPRNSNVTPSDNLATNAGEPVTNYLHLYDGTNWDRIRSTDGANNTSATETGILAAGVGPGHSRVDTSQTITANAQSRTFNTRGTEQLGITISGTWTGTLTIEYTVDGSTWVADTTGIDATTLVQYSGTNTANGTWFFDSSSVLQYRVRSTAWTSGTANITFVGSVGSAITYGAIIAPRPDRIGIVHTHKNARYSSTQTGTAIWTPASGKKVALTRLTVSTGGTTAGIVTIWYGASGDTTFSTGTDQVVWEGEFAPSTTSKPFMNMIFDVPEVANTADYVLRITSSAAMTLYVSCYGYEFT